MNADRILSLLGVFIAGVALMLAPSRDTILEPLRMPLIYVALAVIVILAIWLVVIAIKKPISPELKEIRELRQELKK